MNQFCCQKGNSGLAFLTTGARTGEDEEDKGGGDNDDDGFLLERAWFCPDVDATVKIQIEISPETVIGEPKSVNFVS